MSFTLSISSNAVSFVDADLFEGEEFFYDVSFYDDASIKDVKIPFYTSLTLPLTPTNKSIFGYDPINTNVSSFPSGDYHFIISYHNSFNTEIRGIMTVDSIEYNSDQPYMSVTLKDYLSLFFSELSEKKLGDILTSSYHTSNHPLSDFFKTTANNGEAGVAGQDPDLTRIVNFPFVDMCNDVEKFDYETRQFTEYGSGETRSGFIPTLSVKNYLKQVGEYLSTSNIPVKVKSKLFGINESEAIPDFQPSKLQAVIPAKLQAKRGFNTRNFTLYNRFDTAFPNEDMTENKNLFGNQRQLRTNYYGKYTVFGHYGTIPANYNPIKKHALEWPDDGYVDSSVDTSGEKGYISPHTSFGAEISFASGNRTETIGTLTWELPVVDEEKMVYKIFPNNSDMSFNLKLGIFVDGYLTKSIGMLDSNGDKLELNAQNATVTQSNAVKSSADIPTVGNFFGLTSGSLAYLDDSSFPNYNDSLQWNNIEVYLPNEERFIDLIGDSRYGMCYYLEPLEGSLDITYADQWYAVSPSPMTGYTVYYNGNIVNSDFGPLKIRKAITKISNYTDFDIKFTANRDFSPYYPDDRYNIKDSINNTCDIKVPEFLDIITKRFGCGIFYEYDGSHHILRIDPLHILRTSNVNIDSRIDDLNSIVVSRPIEIIKNLVITNEGNDLFYDSVRYKETTRGSTTQEINPNGINDFELKLDSAVYYKTLCGEDNSLTNENVIKGYLNEYQIGYTKNIFTPYNEFSVRFAYIDNPLFQTKIKVPYIVNNNVINNLTTTTQRLYRNIFDYVTSEELDPHVFNGRLSNKNTAGWDLLAEDEDELTTDYYDLIASTEQLKTKQYPSIEFDMVVPVGELTNSAFMFSKGILSYINNQKVLIKEAKGQVYDDNAYLSVKGLIE
jgi:hypothetical protein